jgi:UDP-N-acetylmuramate dehydrogenase
MDHLKNLQHNVPLGSLTTYKIGGPAEFFVEVTTQAELATTILAARSDGIPYFILGTGANILIGDRGIPGLTIHNRAYASHINGNSLVAESGATIADLITLSTAADLSGLEDFAGIPSSVGGAVRQNLHFLSPDRSKTVFIADTISSARILDTAGKIREVDRDFFEFGYDDSILHHQEIIVLEVIFSLTPSNTEKIQAQIVANLAWRLNRQPQLDEFPSCGSVFKKIEGAGAGRLIERAGLKGRRVGDIQVSPKHANYLINLGNGTAQEVRELIEIIQTEVEADSGHRLEPEIGFIGQI